MKIHILPRLLSAVILPTFSLLLSACIAQTETGSSSSEPTSLSSLNSGGSHSSSPSLSSSPSGPSSRSSNSSHSGSSLGCQCVTIPSLIEAEDYVNFMDSTPGNIGEVYRQDDVDIEATEGGGFNVGWVAPGEWLEYEFQNTQREHYDIRFSAASGGAGGRFSLWLNDEKIGSDVLTPHTGGWQQWRNRYARFIEIPAGDHTLRILIESGEFNIDALELTIATANPSHSINVMSFNVRTADANDPGEGSWNTRRAEVVKAVQLGAPDLLGIQEANDVQFNYLLSELGSNWSATNIRILYRNDLFVHEDGGIIHLVDDVWGDRFAEWARMRRISDNKTLIFLNTHWGVDAPSQQGSAEIMRDRLREVNDNWAIPTVLLGDLNATPQSKPISTLLQTPLVSFVAGGTFNGWNMTAELQLDYILGSKVDALSCDVMTYREGDLPPSDHFPIVCELLMQQDDSGNTTSHKSDVICVLDYDLTLSSHACPATIGQPEYHCSTVGPTYGWTEQCLATAAQDAIQRCITENAKVADASHSPYDQAKIDALNHTLWPSGAPILMQPGRNKAAMIQDIQTHYDLPNAEIIFWDDSSFNISAVSGMENITAIKVDRGDPEQSNCGIQPHHINQGWSQITSR